MDKFTFIDLFCGIGGFHQAMTNLGGTCVFASDIDKTCRETYKDNYGIEPAGDITQIEAKDIPSHDVLCAGFPCCSFSKAGNRLGFEDPTRGTLFFDVMRIARQHQPKYMLLENVRNLAGHDGGNTWKVIHDAIVEAGYNVLEKPVIFSPHYIGIPQHRERVYIMCVRKDVGDVPEFQFSKENAPQCSIDTILLDDEDIPNIDRYKLDLETIVLINLWNEFIQNIKCEKLPGFPIWAGSLRESGNTDGLPEWKANFEKHNNQLYCSNKIFLQGWLLETSLCSKFFGSKAKLEWQAGNIENPNLWDTIMQFRPSGLRCKPGTYFPALVAITQTSIVGKRKRYLTPRECARLQSFPDDFKICPNDGQAYKQFGNSVNVACVELFAKYMFGDKETRERYANHI